MTIKLVRTDAVDPCKIQLPLGEHVFGRGKLLECDDKRISRQHGKLSVSIDSLTITALHQNPCFFIKKGVTNMEVLRQNNTITLCNGDKFGLLPDTFWYEVIFCSGLEANNVDTERNTEEYGVSNNECDKTTQGDVNQTETSDFHNSDDGFDNEIAKLEPLIATGNNDPTQELNNDPEITNSNQISEKTIELSEVNTNKEGQLNEQNEPNVENEADLQNEPNVQSEPIVQNEPNLENETNAPSNDESNSSKRSHSPDNSDVKKIKTEPVEVKSENTEDVKPGPSLNQVPAKDGAACANNAPNNNQPLRERCMYGANCYRKNPQHLSQFSHPRDSDWGPGERGICPYGASCGKTDPRHWRDHDHPPGKVPPPRPGQKKKRDRRVSSDSDDSPAQGLVVAGKRARKAIARPQPCSDTDEEPDPYATDESDEWTPGTAPSQEYSEDYL
ncbi:aprataxin and PNK-like factor isoform X1 [Maniola jurtina]|uniref:aprataxin and PNK-like factor isoform X1 n=1 Tax=Maniola jurtina TaxID=191418 RepID=UPI001E68CF01|nr:aprataxin and PNK-like factor isoform X1 [Maniola jurtina]